MMNFFDGVTYLLFMLAFGFALFGWGNLPGGTLLYSVRIVLGMAVALIIGGIANLLGLAYGITLNLFIAGGIYLGFRELISHNRLSAIKSSVQSCQSGTIWLLSASFLAAYVILAATVMVPEVYNYHDDLQKYFIHPVKLLATGSMYGSPLTALGTETLGGQALLQAFFVNNLGVASINVFDSTFCLLLSCLLLVEYGARKNHSDLGLLAALLLFLIYPQQVNISSLYSFVAFAIATLLITNEITKNLGNASRLNHLFALLGVMYASVVVLKTTYALFPLVHFPIFLLSLMTRSVPARTPVRAAIIATGSGVVASGIWLVEPATLIIAYGASGDASIAIPYLPDPQNLLRLFATDPLFYSGTALQYSCLVLLSLTAAALLFTNRATPGKRTYIPESPVVLSATITLVFLYAYLTLVVGTETNSFSTSLRYSIPFIISTVPLVTLLTLCLLKNNSGKHVFIAFLGLTVFVLSLQTSSTLKGWRQSINCGSNLSFGRFACSDRYRQYNKVVLGDFGARQVQGWQAKVPPGEPIIAWINYGHHLDFKRNPIFEVDPAGLSNPWTYFPEANYIMIDTGGFATRKRELLENLAQDDYLYRRNIWINTLRFMDYLEQSIPIEAVLFRDRQVGVFKIARPERKFGNSPRR